LALRIEKSCRYEYLNGIRGGAIEWYGFHPPPNSRGMRMHRTTPKNKKQKKTTAVGN